MSFFKYQSGYRAGKTVFALAHFIAKCRKKFNCIYWHRYFVIIPTHMYNDMQNKIQKPYELQTFKEEEWYNE